jgi:hypothetical protein
MTRILIISIIFLTSCNYVNTDKKRSDEVESRKTLFYDNQETFEQIIGQLINDQNRNNKIGRSIKPNEFDDLTNKKLRRLEIEYITVSNTNCDEFEFEFMTSWTEFPIGQMYLTKTGCNETKSTKGNYWTDTNFIEVWGLGDGWIIWTDSDFI